VAAAAQNLTKPTPKPQFYGLYKLRKKESVTFQALVFYSKSNQYFNLYFISPPPFLSFILGASFFPLFLKHRLLYRTGVRFASLFSGGFITAIVDLTYLHKITVIKIMK
jgi:hypothetical protein